jgi:methylamine--corrinoid protein Co-methyltransferase
MISFLGIFKRSQTGPYMSEMDFELTFDQKFNETVKKYGIKYDPEHPIPRNDQMADDLFQAGLKFYEKIGTYCVDFQRVIKLSKEEILETLDQAFQKM